MNFDDAAKSPSAADSGVPELQFDRVEPAQSSSALACVLCGTPIRGQYFSLNGHTLCPSCAEAQRLSMPEEAGKTDFARAALYGAGAALAGTALYFGVLAVTGYEIGLIAVAVGWLVGKAVQKGSREAGGRKLQIMAVILTYLSIVGSYAPLTIKYALDNRRQAETESSQARTQQSPDSSITNLSIPVAFVLLLAYCLIAPFLQGMGSIIGVFIIGIGLWEAWKLNQRVPLTLEGPFAVAGTDVSA